MNTVAKKGVPRSAHSDWLRQSIEQNYPLILFPLILLLAGFAWLNRFVTDDAFICFRYALNLVEGNGLVWNPGEWVEGYTNFLWTLILSVPIALGIDPVTFCFIVGPILSALTLYFTSLIAMELFQSKILALLTITLIGLNPTFSAFATSGLETQFLTCLQTTMLATLLQAVRTHTLSLSQALTLSLLGSAALLTRLDAVLVVGLVLAISGLCLSNLGRGQQWIMRLALCTPCASIIGVWFAWKFWYYGSILPNTFYAKVSGLSNWALGLDYLWTFLRSYWLAPFPLLWLFAGGQFLNKTARGAAILLLLLVIHSVYLISIGGDFMEFRMLVPVLPIFVLLTVWIIFNYFTTPLLQTAFIAIVVIGAGHHYKTFRSNKIESVENLSAHLNHESSDWIGIGQELRRVFSETMDARIAVTASGAISYYSKLYSLDMLGLSDPWIARHGIRILSQPGHQRLAPIEYLVQRRINLVLADRMRSGPSPPDKQAYRPEDLAAYQYLPPLLTNRLPSTATILEIRRADQRTLVALYLERLPAIERAIQTHQWRQFPIHPNR